MSLINDMLRDLEARKRAARQAGEGHSAGAPAEAASADAKDTHITPSHVLRDAGAHVGLDERVRRRGRWLLPVYALVLAALAVALYVAVAGPNGLLRRDAYSRALAEPAAPAPAPRVADAAPANANVPDAPAAAAQVPRLVMIGVDEAQGPALTLRLRFAPALATPLRVNASEGRVQLGTEGAQVGVLESPSPLLPDWHSEQIGERWQASFAWHGRAEVSLLPVLGEDASQGWVIRLLPAEPARDAARSTHAATASAPPAAPSSSPSPSPSRAAVAAPVRPVAESRAVPVESAARDADTLYADAWRLHQAGQGDDAIGRLQSLLQREPLHARGRELLARLWLGEGRVDQAIQVLNDGLAAQPGQPAWVELQARLLDRSGHRSDAIALLDAQGSPQRLGHQALRGILNTQEGRFADAAKAYQAAIALEPGEPRWWLGLALAWDNLGDRVAARSAYQGALDTGRLDGNGERFARERIAALADGATR
ncbi:MAG: tetratricopeptide repeat protein [Xanthomonadaceae bacterium]|nr:tetratricopeptide repeat protein [Xanthomonadaceae bacterium]